MNFGFRDGNIVDIKGDEAQVHNLIRNLTGDEREQLLLSCLQQPGKRSATVSTVFDIVAAKTWQGLVAGVLFRLGTRMTARKAEASAYSVKVETKDVGTVTTVNDGAEKKYLWAARAGAYVKPEPIVAAMVGACFRPREGKMVCQTFSPGKELNTLFPTRNPFAGIEKVGDDCRTEEALVAKLEKTCETVPGFVGSAARQLYEMAPASVQGPGSTKVQLIQGKDKSHFVKAGPSKVTLTTHKYDEVVAQIVKMVPTIGSTKHGFGKMSANHYDGNVGLSAAARARQEFLDDYRHVETDVYLLDVSDASLACGMQRVIANHRETDKPFAVIYRTSDVDRQLGRVLMDDGTKYTRVITSGLIGLHQAMWPRLAGLFPYFIANNTFKVGGGKGGSIVEGSRLAREPMEEKVKGYKFYSYYGFVGAISENETVSSSCGGRTGKVIFSHDGQMGRIEAAQMVFQMVRHAILYPWMSCCYTLTREGRLVYPGARVQQGRYDYTPLETTQKFITSITEEEVTGAIVGAAYMQLLAGVASKGHVSEGEEAEEQDTSLFEGDIPL